MSKGQIIGIAVAAIVIIGGIGYFVMNAGGRNMSATDVGKQKAAMEAAQRNMPGQMQKNRRPGGPGGMPGGGMPGGGYPGGRPGGGYPGGPGGMSGGMPPSYGGSMPR